jgi:eukaryotic-like serine/threonine-protein kinase
VTPAPATGAADAVAQAPEDDLGVDDSSALLVGQVVADRYRIVELLGRGGMGAVYRADHVHIRKSFALKVLHRELTHHAEAVKRFEREAIAAARIDHPNVATAIDFGRLESGAFFLVLDYVQGQSLRRLLEDEQQLPELRALRIARQIASALAAAHAAGIVHRDLKPDNVMLVEAGTESDFVKVLDFGIAKLRTEDIADEPAITRFGTVFGTPEYMSPEQALGQTVDVRSDLYTLGIMLYEMLVGKTPFADEQLVIILTRQMTEPPAPLPDTVSTETRQLVMQLLEKQPDGRPATAELVFQNLDTIVSSMLNVSGSHALTPTALQPRGVGAAAIATSETLYAKVDAGAVPIRRARSTESELRVDLPATGLATAARNPSLPPWVRRQVTVAGRRIPLVLLAMGATMLAASAIGIWGLWAVFARHGDQGDVHAEAPLLSALLGDDAETKQLKSWMEQATNGDPVALQQLEARPESARTATEWAALGAGRAHEKQWSAMVVAYDRALQTDPKLLLGKHALANVLLAAMDAQASQAALELAARRFGGSGADLIYAALESGATGRPSKVDRRKAKSLLEANTLSPQASPALRVALKLDAARSCSEYKSLLAEVAAVGDQRCTRSLKKLTHDRGCGILDLQDCYPCLRGSRALADAIETTKARPSPVFLEPQPDAAPRSGSR